MITVTALRLVICAKIVFTITCVVLLFLYSPNWLRNQKVRAPPVVFARLLGCAYAALIMVYLKGLSDSWAGKDISHVVWVGIVSNGSAFVVLLWFCLQGKSKSWSRLARTLLWLVMIILLSITAGLTGFGLIGHGAFGKSGPF